jgi:hypothetical protein
MSTHGKKHWKTVKRVFRYLCGIKYYAIFYQGKPGGDSELNVHGFVNTKWVVYMDHQRYTNGYVFNMFDGAIN